MFSFHGFLKKRKHLISNQDQDVSELGTFHECDWGPLKLSRFLVKYNELILIIFGFLKSISLKSVHGRRKNG